LSVGGTALNGNVESAAKISGGGFSNVFARPAWQKATVDAYIGRGQGLPPQGNWNVTGRAMPDVSALAINYQVGIAYVCACEASHVMSYHVMLHR
jgi:tripeptidyl-peptidase-1